jgi:hypothetical protein
VDADYDIYSITNLALILLVTNTHLMAKILFYCIFNRKNITHFSDWDELCQLIYFNSRKNGLSKDPYIS